MQIPGKKGFVVLERSCRGQLAHEQTHPGVGVEAVGLSRVHQRVDDGACVGAGGRIAEQPCLAPDHEGADGALADVVVDRQYARGELILIDVDEVRSIVSTKQ